MSEINYYKDINIEDFGENEQYVKNVINFLCWYSSNNKEGIEFPFFNFKYMLLSYFDELEHDGRACVNGVSDYANSMGEVAETLKLLFKISTSSDVNIRDFNKDVSYVENIKAFVYYTIITQELIPYDSKSVSKDAETLKLILTGLFDSWDMGYEEDPELDITSDIIRTSLPMVIEHNYTSGDFWDNTISKLTVAQPSFFQNLLDIARNASSDKHDGVDVSDTYTIAEIYKIVNEEVNDFLRSYIESDISKIFNKKFIDILQDVIINHSYHLSYIKNDIE